MNTIWEEEFFLESSFAGGRLDRYLLTVVPADISRSRLQNLLHEGKILVNDQIVKPGYRLRTGDKIRVRVPAPVESSLEAENIPLEIIYEDRDLVVINKPAGLTVHPGSGQPDHTLVNALLFLCRDLSGIGGQLRPGIVHRLDRDTSGLIVAAKNDTAHLSLSRQFSERRVKKTYYALVTGKKIAVAGTINQPIGRNPVHRQKMAIRPDGREAVTGYRVLKQFGDLAFLEVRPKTGRTHQIRVHLVSINCPILGDKVYGGRSRLFLKGKTPIVIPRQALHAGKLGFIHPSTNAWMEFESPLPEDMQKVVDLMENELA